MKRTLLTIVTNLSWRLVCDRSHNFIFYLISVLLPRWVCIVNSFRNTRSYPRQIVKLSYNCLWPFSNIATDSSRCLTFLSLSGLGFKHARCFFLWKNVEQCLFYPLTDVGRNCRICCVNDLIYNFFIRRLINILCTLE